MVKFNVRSLCNVRWLFQFSAILNHLLKAIKYERFLDYECSPSEIQRTPLEIAYIIQSYTNIYVNTQLFLLLMQLYFVLGDMFRLIKQPSSGQITIEQYLIILRPIWDPTLFTHTMYIKLIISKNICISYQMEYWVSTNHYRSTNPEFHLVRYTYVLRDN